MEMYERLEELDADKAEVRASRILHGLGFTAAMQRKKLKDISGGWRMRVALARYSLTSDRAREVLGMLLFKAEHLMDLACTLALSLARA